MDPFSSTVAARRCVPPRSAANTTSLRAVPAPESELNSGLLIPEPPYKIDQATNLNTSQFLAKGRHPCFTMADDRNQTASVRDIGMLSPPIGIREIRCVVRMPERRVTCAVSAVTSRAIVPEQIADLSSRGSGYGSFLRRRSSDDC